MAPDWRHTSADHEGEEQPATRALGEAAGGSGSSSGAGAFAPGEILIRFRPDASPDEARALAESLDAMLFGTSPSLGIYWMKTSRPVEEALALARSRPSVEEARPNLILAEVGDEIVTLLEMESLIQGAHPSFGGLYARDDAKRKFLNSLVDRKLFARAAREEGLPERPDVERRLRAAVEQALADAYSEKLTHQVTVSEEELREYYEKHPDEFQNPELIKSRHILVGTREEAEQILDLLKAGREFEAIAKEKSSDPTVHVSSESAGWFARGRRPPEFEEVAFALSPGEVSDVVETKFGYFVIELEARRERSQRPFSEAKQALEVTLLAKKRTEELERARRELALKYAAKLHLESLSEVQIVGPGEPDTERAIRTLRRLLEKGF